MFSPLSQIGTGGLHISDKEKSYVMDVLNSNRLTYGKYSIAFENDFASIHQCKFGILSNSGTSSLQVALACLKECEMWNDGDEIICPATTFVASSNVILDNNLTPVFVDVDPIYYEIDVSKIEEKITEKTKCIMVVHLFGQPCDMEEIWRIAKKHNLKIIEDSCETMFAKYKDKTVGNLGDIACFSMYTAHILVTGVGGIATTNNPRYAIVMRSLVNHGRNNIYITIDDDKNTGEEKLKEIISKRFQFVRRGYSYRITEMESALGLAQLEKWEDNIKERKKNAQYYTEQLSEFSSLIQLPKIRENNDHVFMMYPIIILDDKISKQKFCEFLEKNLIETRDMLPLVNQPFYKTYFPIGKYPVSEKIVERGFYIGSHPFLTDDEKGYIVSKIKEFLTTE